MIPGRQPLESIEAELDSERRAVAELDDRLASKSERLLEVGKAQAGTYRELARLRVQALASRAASAGGVADDLDAAERHVTSLLRRREAAGSALAEETGAAERTRSALEAERVAEAEKLAAAAASVDAAEAAAQARLQADPAYRAQLDKAHEADRIALHAEEKATRSEREQDEKGRAYREDPLFMYLWRRRYGTAGYRGAPLFRWLDDKVARHAGFLAARSDYARLLEIPQRLREHASARRGSANGEYEALSALDRAAREADGIPALEASEAAQAARVQAVDERLEQLASEVQSLLARRERMAAGEDQAYLEAVETLAGGLRSEALQALHQEAVATPFPEDDVLIARLAELQREQVQLETAAEELKAARQQRSDRLHDLESLRAEFKHRQYDQPGHGFDDGALVATVLANVIGGMLDRGALWRVLDQQRRFQPPRTDTTFGSGGFGRGSPWGGALRPRGGGRGFGGGGFRTGGKF